MGEVGDSVDYSTTGKHLEIEVMLAVLVIAMLVSQVLVIMLVMVMLMLLRYTWRQPVCMSSKVMLSFPLYSLQGRLQ